MLNDLKQSISRDPDVMSRVFKSNAIELVESFVVESIARFAIEDLESKAQLDDYAVDLLINFFGDAATHNNVCFAMVSLALIKSNLDIKAIELRRK